MVGVVDDLPVAERLPLLYRVVLDRIAALEMHGRRPDAAAIRRDATAAYSRAWNASAERRLRSLIERSERLLETERANGDRSPERGARRVDPERSSAA